MSTLRSKADVHSREDALDRELDDWIAGNGTAAADALRELIAIPSVQGDPVPDGSGGMYPYGRPVQDAFAYMLDKGSGAGFRVMDADHYAGHIAFGSGGDPVGVLAHLDVVPAGEGWSFDPFGGTLSQDGYICGRGAQDDKGPLLAVFFAMKALRDLGWEPEREIRLILGLDEETGTDGLRHYLRQAGNPACGFTPDAGFPVIHGEKGILEVAFAKKLGRMNRKGLHLRKLSGGEAVNVVPQSARALVNAPDAARYEKIISMARDYAAETRSVLKTRRTGKSLEIRSEGVPAHASAPEKGRNAISVLMDFLGRLDFVNDDLNDFIRFYNSHIGFRTDGSGMGAAMRDDASGPLTMNAGVLHFDREAVSVACDVRYPVTIRGDAVCQAFMPQLDAYGMGLVIGNDDPPLWVPEDDPLVESLMRVYRDETGDTDARPLVSGGGTYARECPGIVAFGGLFPGDEDRMHMRNERISVKRYLQLIHIYAKALAALSARG